jgi:uncharacterized membrane protein
MGPHLAAVLASVPFFFFARGLMKSNDLDSIAGVLPLAQAALLGGLLWVLVRDEASGSRYESRLVLVAGAALAFFTAAIPVQLDKEWITVAWALEVAALAWLNTKITHRGLSVAITLIGSFVFMRLVLNPSVFSYHPRSSVKIFNWYLYTYAVSAAAFFVAAWLLTKREGKQLAAILQGAATIFLFLLLNIEIADVYSKGSSLTFDFNATLAQNLTYTIGWGVFAIGLLLAGIVISSRAARVTSIALLVVTIFKCFLWDLSSLGGLYRVGSLIGLALCLSAVALLLQRFVFRMGKTAPDTGT